MKKILLAVALAATCMGASAGTQWVNGILYGNVCRSGAYFTIYPYANAQPVGTSCPVRNQWGYVVGYGTVTNE